MKCIMSYRIYAKNTDLICMVKKWATLQGIYAANVMLGKITLKK